MDYHLEIKTSLVTGSTATNGGALRVDGGVVKSIL
jgi:hypothetical protein